MSETANLQDTLLRQALKEHMPVTLFLMNGFQLRGVIAGFDNFVVVLMLVILENLDALRLKKKRLVVQGLEE